MDTNEDSKYWECVLDHELARVEVAVPASEGDRQDSNDARHATGSGEAGSSAGVTQLREGVFESIRNGTTLTVDIWDESGVRLLPAGCKITKQFVQELRDRGIRRVRLGKPKPAQSDSNINARFLEGHSKQSRELDKRLAGELSKPCDFHSVKAWRRPRLSVEDLKGHVDRGCEEYSATSSAVAEICSYLEKGRVTSVDELKRCVSRFVDMAAVDFDLLPLIASARQSGDEYLYDHCVSVAMLSMAFASQLGLDADAISTIGMGGMLQDIGMLRVPLSIRLTEEPLTEHDWLEIRRHPFHTLDLVSELRGLPQAVKFIAYQAHERANGRGYPRQRRVGQVHPYAQIVAIADVFSAMTGKRPYRPALSPYIAIKTILQEAATEKFDRGLVRIFLDTISLFPTGSEVGLSDGTRGRVLRANPGLHTRPVVEEISEDGHPLGNIIDLSQQNAPQVVTAM